MIDNISEPLYYNGMPYKDRDKEREYKKQWNKQHYIINREKEIARIFKRKNEISKWFADYKEVLKCEICGENSPECLDFHHLKDSVKEFNLGYIKNRGYGKDRILSEISKCKVLCANCHRKLHAGKIKI